MANKQDSNLTGLRYCTEASLKTLPGSPVFKQFEPNSYGDFGGSTAKTARNPITNSRQRKKGVTVDLDASGSFNQDLTLDNTLDVLQGFMFADARCKPSTQPINASASVAMTATTTTTYTAASGLSGFKVGAKVLASGFTLTANNGVKDISAVASGSLTTTGLAVETPPAAAKLETVGHKFASADCNIAMNGSLVRLTTAAADFTTFGFVEGEWVYLGSDTSSCRFANNVGFARIGKGGITSGYLQFDKVSWTPQAETGTGKTIELYFGTVVKNELVGSGFKRRSYHLERQVGTDADGTMSEYLVGAVPNEFTLTVPRAEKITCDLGFMAMDHEPRTGLQGLKSGTRPNLAATDAYNTSNDVARIKLSLADSTNASTTPLFAYAEDLNLTVNNNCSVDKAIGVLGGFDITAGTFEVGGSMTVFFADNVAVTAVRNNSDVTLDIVLVQNNAGIAIDVPLITLGDGRLNIEQNQSIKLPLETNAAESTFGHTILFNAFSYLPTLAG
jgi:hypothetical protein